MQIKIKMEKHASIALVLENYFNNMYAETWSTTYNYRIPKQENEYDCGVFMVTFMWNIAEDKPHDFQKANMVDLRKKFKKIMSDI
jgi:Ulp1 family protease